MPNLGLMGCPSEDGKVCLGVYVSDSMHKALSRQAVEEDRTISAIVRIAIKEYLEKYGGNKKRIISRSRKLT